MLDWIKKYWKYIAAVVVGGIAYTKFFGLPKKQAVTTEEKTFAAETTEEKLIKKAMQQCGLSRDQLTVRGLLPSDLDVSSWNFVIGSGNAYNSIVNTTVRDCRFIAITSVTYTGTNITGIKIDPGAITSEIWNIQTLQGQENKTFYDSSPTIINQNLPVKINAYALAPAASETISFGGIVVEPRGFTTA